MNPQQLIAKHFTDEVSVTAYMTERLSVDEAHAASLVAHYHVSERLEDELFTIYHEDGFSKEQKQWFWNALNTLAKTAWQNKQAVIFERIVYLYSRLGYEQAKQFNWSDCFVPEEIQWPKNIKGIDDERISLYSSALSLIFAWQLIANNNQFWQDQFKDIVGLLPQNENLQRPLNIVSDAIDQFTGEQWGRLFISCQNSENLRNLAQHYLTIHFELCEDDAQNELDLIGQIQVAVKKVKNQGIGEEFVTIMNSWIEMPWWLKNAEVEVEQEKLSQMLKSKEIISPQISNSVAQQNKFRRGSQQLREAA